MHRALGYTYEGFCNGKRYVLLRRHLWEKYFLWAGIWEITIDQKFGGSCDGAVVQCDGVRFDRKMKTFLT